MFRVHAASCLQSTFDAGRAGMNDACGMCGSQCFLFSSFFCGPLTACGAGNHHCTAGGARLGQPGRPGTHPPHAGRADTTHACAVAGLLTRACCAGDHHRAAGGARPGQPGGPGHRVRRGAGPRPGGPVRQLHREAPDPAERAHHRHAAAPGGRGPPRWGEYAAGGPGGVKLHHLPALGRAWRRSLEGLRSRCC